MIIRSPKMGAIDLTAATFKQMCGRAGRMNLDAEGEAVLMIQPSARERSLAARLTSAAELPPLASGIREGSGGGIARLLLEIIYCGIAQTEYDLNRYPSLILY